jgi:nickel transport protein
MRANGMTGKGRWVKGSLALAFSISLLLIAAGSVEAHRVTIFAWVEGDTIYTESKFSGGKKVNKGKIIVYNLHGKQLLEGETNEQGEFSFKLPEKTALKIALQAGTGHRAEWTVPLEEIEGIDSVAAEAVQPQSSSVNQSEKQMQSMSNLSLSPEDIQLAVEKALDKKLKPVIKMLAESQVSGPTYQDILGGIGYILGLVGVACFVHYRRKKTDLPGS